MKMQVCRICLATNTKMYKLQNALKDMYEQTTGLYVTPRDNLPQKLCWECAARLAASSRLRTKALKSHQLMIELVNTVSYLTAKSLKTIDRDVNYLNSTLTLKTYDINHSDLHLHDTISSCNYRIENTQEIDEKSAQELDLQLDIEVKEENEPNGFEFMDENSSSSSDVVLAKHKKEMECVEKRRKKGREKKVAIKVDRRRKPANEVLNEDIFSITELSLEEQIAEIMKRRDTGNYKNSEFKCGDCFKGFLDEDAYKGHVVRHTNDIGVHRCSVCKVHFRTRHALRNHASAHAQRFSCRKCAYVTTRRHAAKLHEEYHNGTRYQCPYCSEDFVKFSTYMSHVRIKHPSDFVCSLCGCSYVSAKGLGLHKKLKHRFDDRAIPSDGPSCDRCNVTFVSEEAIERHLKMSARHNQNKNEASKIRQNDRCKGKDQSEEQKKKRRSVPCKPEGPIPCEQCDIQLPDALSYYRHFRRAHPDKNRTNYPSMKSKSMCEVCGKMFQSLALLQDHSWTHTDSKQFACGVCHKRFQRQYRLIAHRRLHVAPAQRHACAACPKRFSTASNLQRHMVSHTGLKPFKCEMCGKCFKHASEKRVHITYVHLKKPWPKRSRGKRRSDGRQNQLQEAPPTCVSETDIVQPLWPACSDPKITDSLVHEKQLFTHYNLKL